MRLDEGIQNLVSELKSGDIDPSFWPKNGRKVAKYPFCQFSTVFYQKWVKCHPISILRPDLESFHQGASLRPQHERNVKTLFFDPHCNFKTLVAGGSVG